MKITAQEDISLPIDAAFREVANLDYIERQLMRVGVRVFRDGSASRPVTEERWQLGVPYGGGRRQVDVRVGEWRPPTKATVYAMSGGLSATLDCTFTALSKSSTRLQIAIDVSASGLKERMVLHGAQLAHGKLKARLAKTVAAFARDAEGRAETV